MSTRTQTDVAQRTLDDRDGSPYATSRDWWFDDLEAERAGHDELAGTSRADWVAYSILKNGADLLDPISLKEEPGDLDLSGINWAIVGGESGLDYREMDHAWAREIYRQCREQNVAFFFKQNSGPRPEMGTALTVRNEQWDVYEQREIKESLISRSRRYELAKRPSARWSRERTRRYRDSLHRSEACRYWRDHSVEVLPEDWKRYDGLRDEVLEFLIQTEDRVAAVND